MASFADAVHHPVGADSYDAIDVVERESCLAKYAFRVRRHRLHYVAAKMRILRAHRSDLLTRIGRPDHLVGRLLDFLAFEQVLALLIPGEVNDVVVLRFQGTGD